MKRSRTVIYWFIVCGYVTDLSVYVSGYVSMLCLFMFVCLLVYLLVQTSNEEFMFVCGYVSMFMLLS